MKLKRRRPACSTSSAAVAASLWFLMGSLFASRTMWVIGEYVSDDSVDKVQLVEFYLLPRYGSYGQDSYQCTSLVADYVKTGALNCLQNYTSDICHIDPILVQLGEASCSGTEVMISGGYMGFSLDSHSVPTHNDVQACLPQVMESDECLTQMQNTLSTLSYMDFRSVFVYTVPPTPEPSFKPTLAPTPEPTSSPTFAPTFTDTETPTNQPSSKPTVDPTSAPTPLPTAKPTRKPTKQPIKRTERPTRKPTSAPSKRPSAMPKPPPPALDSGNSNSTTASAIQSPLSLTSYPFIVGAGVVVVILVVLLFAGRLHYKRQQQQKHEQQGDQSLPSLDPTTCNERDDKPQQRHQNSPGSSSKSSNSSRGRRRLFGTPWDDSRGGDCPPSRSALRTERGRTIKATPISAGRYVTADSPGDIATPSGLVSISDSETMASITGSLRFMAAVEVDNDSVLEKSLQGGSLQGGSLQGESLQGESLQGEFTTEEEGAEAVAVFSTEEQPIHLPTTDAVYIRDFPPASEERVETAVEKSPRRMNPFIALYRIATSKEDTASNEGEDPGTETTTVVKNDKVLNNSDHNNNNEFELDPSWNPDDNSVNSSSERCEPFLPSPTSTSTDKRSLLVPFSTPYNTSANNLNTPSNSATESAGARNRMVPMELPEMQGRRKASPEMQGRRGSSTSTSTPPTYLNYV